MKRFEGQVAVVTGGGDGLGRSIGLRLLREGAEVYLADRDVEKARGCLVSADFQGLTPRVLSMDVSQEESVKGGFQEVMDQSGRLDIVVNCAGIVGPNGVKVTDVSVDDFERVQSVNLTGSFLACKWALKHMALRNYGRILLVASIAGKEGNAGMACYSASKAGVMGLVKSVGKEFAETGITINGLAPAVIRTAMVESMVPEQVRYMTDKIPMKRCGTLDEVAALVCWIVSPEASFNTGFTFDLTGGRAVY